MLSGYSLQYTPNLAVQYHRLRMERPNFFSFSQNRSTASLQIEISTSIYDSTDLIWFLSVYYFLFYSNYAILDLSKSLPEI